MWVPAPWRESGRPGSVSSRLMPGREGRGPAPATMTGCREIEARDCGNASYGDQGGGRRNVSERADHAGCRCSPGGGGRRTGGGGKGSHAVGFYDAASGQRLQTVGCPTIRMRWSSTRAGACGSRVSSQICDAPGEIARLLHTAPRPVRCSPHLHGSSKETDVRALPKRCVHLRVVLVLC